MIIILYIFTQWATPLQVTPPSSPYNISSHDIGIDGNGGIWVTWREWMSDSFYVKARHWQNDSFLSHIDTVMPKNEVYSLSGITYSKNNNVWVLGQGFSPWPSIARYHNGSVWSDSIVVPGFMSYLNSGYCCATDSSGNLWVAWSSDSIPTRTVFSTHYNGSTWDTIRRVSFRPPYDNFPAGNMVCAGDSTVWLSWISLTGLPDSLCVSIWDGNNWQTVSVPDGNLCAGYSNSMAASITDNSVYMSYRKTSGNTYLLKYTSPFLPPDTIWINSDFELAPAIVCDDNNNLWLILCDSITQYEYRLYYSIWNGDSMTIPQLVCPDSAYQPMIVFEPVNRRIWVSYMNKPYGNPAVYATYYTLTGIEENEYSVIISKKLAASILRNFPVFPEGKPCRVIDVTGRITMPEKMKPGIYFIEVEGIITQKIIIIK